jgi:hypothetical protein
VEVLSAPDYCYDADEDGLSGSSRELVVLSERVVGKAMAVSIKTANQLTRSNRDNFLRPNI